MRSIRYYVVNKHTKIGIYTNCEKQACIDLIKKLDNPADYVINYKWLSL